LGIEIDSDDNSGYTTPKNGPLVSGKMESAYQEWEKNYQDEVNRTELGIEKSFTKSEIDFVGEAVSNDDEEFNTSDEGS
jgi:hypothetical protein